MYEGKEVIYEYGHFIHFAFNHASEVMNLAEHKSCKKIPRISKDITYEEDENGK